MIYGYIYIYGDIYIYIIYIDGLRFPSRLQVAWRSHIYSPPPGPLRRPWPGIAGCSPHVIRKKSGRRRRPSKPRYTQHSLYDIHIYIYIWIDASKLLTPQKITDLILKKSLKSTQHAPKFISWVACHGLLIHGLHHELQELSVAIHGLPHLSDISAVVIQWGVRK